MARQRRSPSIGRLSDSQLEEVMAIVGQIIGLVVEGGGGLAAPWRRQASAGGGGAGGGTW
ncbi:MAG: hypothetical protein ACKOYH_00895 [Cyanobium sp.]